MTEVVDRIISIVEVTYIEEYKLEIIFNDGTDNKIDFEPFLTKNHHPDIKQYLDKDKFRSYSIRNGNLDWNDFEMCFPTNDLYEGRI
mgnify:CR=1 FL=1